MYEVFINYLFLLIFFKAYADFSAKYKFGNLQKPTNDVLNTSF